MLSNRFILLVISCCLIFFCISCKQNKTNTTQPSPSTDSTISNHSIQSTSGQPSENKKDSLLNLLSNAKEDTVKVNVLNDLAIANRNAGDYESALEYADESLQLAQTLSYQQGLAQAYNCKGNIYNRKGEYPEALKNHLASLKIRELLNDKKGMGASYNNIGNLHTAQGNDNEALIWYNKALQIMKETGNKKGMASSIGNIGLIYFNESNYDEALKKMLEALAIEKELNDYAGISSSYINIAAIYIEMKNYDQAIQYYFDAIEIYKETGETQQAAIAYLNIGDTYISSLKKYEEGKKYILKSLEISKNTGMKETTKNVYSRLIHLDSIQGNYKQAFEDYKNYTLYKDSLTNENDIKAFTEMEMQYQFDKKTTKDSLDYQLKINEEQKTKVEYRNKMYLFIIAAFIIAGLAGIFYFRSNINRKKQLIAQQETQLAEGKVLRAQMNPHFIFNCLNTIDSYVLQSRQQDASLLIQKFSKLSRRILEHTSENYITLNEELETLRIYLQIEQLRKGNTFNYTINAEPETLGFLIPPMLLQPFVENAVLHGMKGVSEGNIYINTKKYDQYIIIEIQDDGIGRTKAAELKKLQPETHKSLSMDLTLLRLEALHKHTRKEEYIRFTDVTASGKGTRVEITIPIKTNDNAESNNT